MGVGKNHAGIGYDLYGNKNRENEKEGRLTHQGSTVQAWEELHSGSGRDTLLIGSQMKGWQVQVETERNLHLESLQDRETYDSRNTGGGFSVSVGGGHVSGSGSAQKQTLRSDYESVTEQAGIYAGDQGFQIQAGGNTHLKGAVIHSDAPAEKNRLETGTLSWEDVENRASYKADGQGVAFSATTRIGQEDRRKLNERGLYPEVVSTVKGRAESTTKAGISAGSIIIREGEKQVQPVKQLNRDTKNSLQKLATIFDKEKVQEKQELVNELSKVGNRAIHELAARKGWQEGSDEKILAHSIFGGLLSSLAGGKIATGSLAGGVGEYVNGRILDAKGKAWVEKHPDLVQAISAVVGSAVGAVTGESSIGSNVSLGETKWNDESINNVYDDTSLLIVGLTLIQVEEGRKQIVDAVGNVIGVIDSNTSELVEMYDDFTDEMAETIIANENLLPEDLVTFAKKTRQSHKNAADDIPSWVINEGYQKRENESGNDFAKRALDGHYGENNYPKGPGSEYNKVRKYGDRKES